jgi:hypothetical protein
MGTGCSQLEGQLEGRCHHVIVIVGHGPSVAGRKLGSWLDTQTVVRLKHAERPNAEDWGTRTDFVCASTPSFWTDKKKPGFPDCEYWVLSEKNISRGPWRIADPRWIDYYQTFNPSFPKPSTGLKAVFCAMEFENPPEIGLIGFDMVLHPEKPTSKWFHEQGKYLYSHDARAEHQCLKSLGVKITEL